MGKAQDIIDQIQQDTTLTPGIDDIRNLNSFLAAQHLIIPRTDHEVATLKSQHLQKHKRSFFNMLQTYIFFKIPLFKPDKFLKILEPICRPLYSKTALTLLALFTGLCVVLLLREWHQFTHSFVYFFTAEGLILSAITLFTLQIFHEIGHAVTAKHYGLKVPTIGIGFIVLFPIMYTDTTDAWRLSSRSHRLIIGISGVVAEIIIAVIASFAWLILDDGFLRSLAFIVASTSWVMTLFINLNPFMRFDGYYLLSDALNIENLQGRSFQYARWKIRKALWGFQSQPPEPLTKRRKTFFMLYACLTWLYRVTVFFAIALAVYHLFFKALGVTLMLAELIYFIGIPIFNELKAWWNLRKETAMNFNIAITTLCFIALIFMISIPLQSSIKAPAMLSSHQASKIFTEHNSLLKNIQVTDGRHVTKGEILVQLESPELIENLVLAKHELDRTNLALSRSGALQSWREQKQVLSEQKKAIENKIKHIEAEIDTLTVTAPISGFVSYMAPSLQTGQWLHKNRHLITITSAVDPVIYTYVKDYQINRLKPGASVSFLSGLNGDIHKGIILAIETSATKTLEDKELSSVYGGDIATQRATDDTLIPHEAIYKIKITPDAKDIKLLQKQKGWVKIEAEKNSVLNRTLQKAASIFIREMSL